jgi:hypothetical protein
MESTNGQLLQFGTAWAERAASILQIVAWAAPLAFLTYTWSTDHFGEAWMAWMLGFIACPNALLASPSRSLLGRPWIMTVVGGVLLPLGAIYAPRSAWMAAGFCCIGWGEWLDAKGQQRGVRSSWRLLSSALTIGAMGVWLWLGRQPAH